MATRTRRFTWAELDEPGEYLRLEPWQDPRFVIEDRGETDRVWRILGDGDAEGVTVEYVEG